MGRSPSLGRVRSSLAFCLLVIAMAVAATALAPSPSAAASRLAWARSYQAAVNTGADEPVFVAAAAEGGVFVSSALFRGGSTGNHRDICTIRYSPGGVRKWVRWYASTEVSPDWVEGIAACPDGGVVVVGCTRRIATNDHWLVVKYTAAGRVQWRTRVGSTADVGQCATGVVVTPKGSVYVAGEAGRSPGDPDFRIMKYSSTGRALWTRWWAGAGAARPRGAALDADGNLYVAGGDQAAGGCAVGVLSFRPTGALRWTRTWDAPGATALEVRGLAVRGGAVAVCGDVVGIAPMRDSFCLSWSASGAPRWTYSGPPPSSEWERALDVDVDRSGRVFAVLLEERAAGAGPYLLRFPRLAAAPVSWVGTDGMGVQTKAAYAVRVTATGSAYFAGRVRTGGEVVTGMLGAALTPVWTRDHAAPDPSVGPRLALTSDAVYVALNGWGGPQTIIVLKYRR